MVSKLRNTSPIVEQGHVLILNSAGIYLFRADNEKNRFRVNNKKNQRNVIDILLVYLLFNLNRFHALFSRFIIDSEEIKCRLGKGKNIKGSLLNTKSEENFKKSVLLVAGYALSVRH